MPDTERIANEVLAVRAQMGDTDARDQLWEQTRLLIFKIARGSWRRVVLHGHDWDDLEQSCYFAFLYAVKNYKPEKGFAFNSYLRRSVQRAVLELLGWRTYRENPRPAISLQLPPPVIDDRGAELQDLISDPTAEAEFELSDATLVVCEALRKLEPLERDVIYLKYWKEFNGAEIGKRLGLSDKEVGKLESSAIRALRRPRIAAPLAAFCGIKNRIYDNLDDDYA